MSVFSVARDKSTVRNHHRGSCIKFLNPKQPSSGLERHRSFCKVTTQIFTATTAYWWGNIQKTIDSDNCLLVMFISLCLQESSLLISEVGHHIKLRGVRKLLGLLHLIYCMETPASGLCLLNCFQFDDVKFAFWECIVDWSVNKGEAIILCEDTRPPM